MNNMNIVKLFTKAQNYNSFGISIANFVPNAFAIWFIEWLL